VILKSELDMCGATRDVRFGPIADFLASNFKVGLGEPVNSPRPGASPQSPTSEAEHKAASVPNLKSP
jgi:hypothetical protein